MRIQAEQVEDYGKKAHDVESFDQTEDEVKVLVHQIAGHKASKDYENQLSSVDARIEAVQKSDLEFVTLTDDNAAAMESLKLTGNRLNGDYASRLHEVVPKAGLSSDCVYVNASTLIQEVRC